MEKSSFFNAVLDANGTPDRVYPAEDFAEFFSTFIGNGIFPNPSTNLQVVADGTSMNVILSMGKAWINGYCYRNTDNLTLKVDPADGVLNRIDRVVLRLDFLNREIKAYVKKGAFASNPVVPALQRNADMYEIGIADIKVNKGVIKITQADITDLRLSKELCGIVHGTVDQVDVTTLFNQYSNALELKEQGFEEEFTTWFNNIKGQLSGDVATNLAVQIEDLRTTKVNYTDLAPITTTGTSSAYIANIPTNMTEVTIVPHISNMAEATLNGVPILDRDGEMVRSDVLNANIPVKLVRVGSNFFIASCGSNRGSLSANRWKSIPAIHVDTANLRNDTILIGISDKYVIYQATYELNNRKCYVAVDRATGDMLCEQTLIKDTVDGYFSFQDTIYGFGVLINDSFISVIYNEKDSATYLAKWNLLNNTLTTTHKFTDNRVTTLIKSSDGYIYGHDHNGTMAKITSEGNLVAIRNISNGAFGGYLTDDANCLYFYKYNERSYFKISKADLSTISLVALTGTSWTFRKYKTFVHNGKRIIWDGYYINYFDQWDMQGNATYSIASSVGPVGLNDDYIYILRTGTGTNNNDRRYLQRMKLSDGTYVAPILAYGVHLDSTSSYKYVDNNTFVLSEYYYYAATAYAARRGEYFEY